MYDNKDTPDNYGAVLNIVHIIKHVMSSATKVELAALYIMARKAVYMRIILNKMGRVVSGKQLKRGLKAVLKLST